MEETRENRFRIAPFHYDGSGTDPYDRYARVTVDGKPLCAESFPNIYSSRVSVSGPDLKKAAKDGKDVMVKKNSTKQLMWAEGDASVLSDAITPDTKGFYSLKLSQRFPVMSSVSLVNAACMATASAYAATGDHEYGIAAEGYTVNPDKMRKLDENMVTKAGIPVGARFIRPKEGEKGPRYEAAGGYVRVMSGINSSAVFLREDHDPDLEHIHMERFMSYDGTSFHPKRRYMAKSVANLDIDRENPVELKFPDGHTDRFYPMTMTAIGSLDHISKDAFQRIVDAATKDDPEYRARLEKNVERTHYDLDEGYAAECRESAVKSLARAYNAEIVKPLPEKDLVQEPGKQAEAQADKTAVIQAQAKDAADTPAVTADSDGKGKPDAVKGTSNLEAMRAMLPDEKQDEGADKQYD